MSHSVDIRPARPGDGPAIISAINDVCAEGIYLRTKRYVPTRQWEAVLHRPGETPRCLLLVPEIDGQVIGWCRVFDSAPPDTGRVADVGIGLLAPYREQGIGTQLVEQAVAWARELDFDRLTADCFATNLRARALFRKAGFVETRIQRCRRDGQHIDEVRLERKL